MINIIILDDEYKGKESDFKDIWNSKFERANIQSNVTIYYSPNQLLKDIALFSLNSILILDLKMDEKDGLSVLHEIRNQHIHIPIIIYSGTITDNMYENMAKDNAFTFVDKPKQKELISAVQEATKLLEDAIPLELSDALNEYLENRPERKNKKIYTKDGKVISFGDIVKEINTNTEIGIDYQKALYKMTFESLINNEKKI